MKKTIFIAFICFSIFIAILSVFSFAESQKEHAAWWVNVYGALSEADCAYVSRVHNIFEKVMAAADKRTNRLPKLVILQHKCDPWALSLKDGTILMTQKAIEICYQGVDKATGDARIAFVLGHELAHLAKDDFWHVAAFEAIQKFGSGQQDPAIQELLELLKRTENIENDAFAKEIIRKKELQADGYGLLYASMAGYDPKIIINTNGENFFQEWASQLTEKAGYYNNENHPDSEQRTLFLLSNIKEIQNELDIFHLGVRLYQVGRYADALAFLSYFNEKFPCREVYNNIGLIHYQMEMKSLSESNPNKAYRFRLSTELDTHTRAEQYRKGCKGDFKDAIKYLKIACEKDSAYLPARVNLSSALIMAEKYAEAVAVLDEALKLTKDDPKSLNNRAIAIYLFGPSIEVDMFQQASNVLKELIEKHPDFPDPYYNLGRLQAERQRDAAVRETWEKYLTLEPTGIYADSVRNSLGKRKESRICKKTLNLPAFMIPISVKLGYPDEETEIQLSEFVKHDLKMGTIEGEYYIKEGIRVLVLEDIVELVELTVESNINISEVKKNYQKPLKIFNNPSGITTFVYDNFAVDVADDKVRRLIYHALPL